MKLGTSVGGAVEVVARAQDSTVRVVDSDRSASSVEQVPGLGYTESPDTAVHEEVVDRTYLPNLILGMEKLQNHWRIPTSQDLI